RYAGGYTPTSSPFSTDANTAGLWHFDEGAGTTTADSSGNNNNGSFVGSPRWVTDSPIGTTIAVGPAITSIGASNVAASVAMIGWATDSASTSQVLFGLTATYGSASRLNLSLDVSHSVTING